MEFDAIRKNKKAIEIAIWIKEYVHALRVFGGIFFFLALLTGVFWVAGKDVEPIAFLFMLISSMLFASPSIAEYVLPTRKPVRHMDYDEILEFIKTTNAKTAWKWVETNWAEEAFLKEDPRLRIRVRWDDDGIHASEFLEPWANHYQKTAESTATSHYYDLFYGGTLIERVILVFIDEVRARVPLPDRTTLEVDPLSYKIAQIFDNRNTLEEYMKGCELSIKSTSKRNG